MSIAAKRSHQGDEYQLRIALHCLIKLLDGDSYQALQVDSTGWPGESMRVSVDDVMLQKHDGTFEFIQAKKNQTDHREWALSDLKDELLKAGDQLQSSNGSVVVFYSRTPFGELEKIAEDCRKYADYAAFIRDAPANQYKILDKLGTLLNRPVEKVFELASRIHFGSHDSFEGWESANRSALRHIVTNVNAAEAVLEALLRSDQSGLRPQKTAIRRQDVVSALERAGCLLAPTYEDTETLKVFTSASQIGRDWPRDVGGVRILRPEFDDVMAAVAEGAKTILVKSAPGVGKTCLILDVAEQLEKEANPALLFIRGDSFDEAVKVEDLITQGLPSDIPGRVARLAESRRVVVIIDSLDVLSLSRNHTALKLFLSLLDRLAGIENVTVLTACREFDLAYDPLLRNRAWGRTVSLGLLDFDATVAPILGKWGIDPGAIGETLRELLRTPKNLRLFREIRQHYSTLQLNTEQELTLAYLRETVAKNPALGTEAMETLRAISSLMLKRRSNKVPDAQAGNADLLRKLKSAGVLIQPDPHMVAFGHQTLGECLVVEGAISRGQSMADFLRTHPQLPYLRPSARAFFLYLRASDPRQLRREIWVALTSGDIAYHIKRLLVESFAGLEPDTEDRRFAIRLFNEQQLLFNNFFWKVTANGWFDFLKDDWLPLVLAEDKADEWRWKFIRRIGQWSKSHPQHALVSRAVSSFMQY